MDVVDRGWMPAPYSQTRRVEHCASVEVLDRALSDL
jgi:hypothetical protein